MRGRQNLISHVVMFQFVFVFVFVRQMYVDSVDSISHVVTLYKCRPDADICINALLAQLNCVRSRAPRSDSEHGAPRYPE